MSDSEGESKDTNQDFILFKSYSDFILSNFLDPVVEDFIVKTKISNLRIFTFLTRFSDDEVAKIFRNLIEDDVLIPVKQSRPFDHLYKKIQAWNDNKSIIPKEQSEFSDILGINIARKRALFNFIKFYPGTEAEKFSLVDEIELYFEKFIEICFKSLQEIQRSVNDNNSGCDDPEKSAMKQEEKDQEFNNIIQTVKDYAIFKLNPDGTVASWNEGAKDLKGYTKDEIIGKHFSIFYPQDKRDTRFPEFELEEAKRTGRFEDEGYRVKKNGTLIWANVVITALFNKEKELIGFTKITRDLTERKNAEEKLKQSEAWLRAMINGVKDYAIFFLNPDGTVASWNDGAKKLKGYQEEEVIGKHFSIFYPEDKQKSGFPEYELEQAIKHSTFEDEGFRVRKDGSLFWANVIITAIFNNDKSLIGFTKVTRDLTEKKHNDEILKQSEERFRYLVEGVKDYAIYMLNPDGTVASWNEGAYTLKGYTKEEIIGEHFSIFYPEEKKHEGFPDFELQSAKANGRFEDEGIRIRKDGSTFWANVVITAIYNDRKELLGFTKITRDLTERKQAEEVLRRSEERYRLLIDGVKDYAIFIIDIDGRISSWNEGARRLKGYTEEEVLGKHISIFYTQDRKNQNFPLYELEQAKKLGRFEDEGLRVKKDGSTFYANVLITALYDKDKNLIGFSKITRDLTERKAFEESLHNINSELEERISQRTEELSKTVKELTKINNDLDNFIYTASHDLKAPVSNIEGLINDLFEEFNSEIKGNPVLETFKDLINVSIKRFQSTILELTEIAKIQKGSMEASEKVNLFNLVDDIKITIHDLIKKNNARIICNFDEHCKIKFVKKNIHSIFYNIISNAIKYRSAERDPVVTITCKPDKDFFVISIEDNGLGLKPEHQARMFTMFKRFHDHVEGSGVGLYIVKRIVENAGGKIEVDSQLGVGTTFRLYIPVNPM